MRVRPHNLCVLYISALAASAVIGCGPIDTSRLDDSKVTIQKLAEASGRIVDSQATVPVFGARVRIGNASTITDDAGAFYLTDLTAGQQTISVVAEGYQAYSQSVELVKGANALGDVRLAKTGADPCSPNPCTPGAATCSADHFTLTLPKAKCTVTGATSYTCTDEVTDCAASNNVCNNGACVANPCIPNTCVAKAPTCTAARELTTYENPTCSVNYGANVTALCGNGTPTANACTTGTYCKTGTGGQNDSCVSPCDANPCAPGTAVCSDDHVTLTTPNATCVAASTPTSASDRTCLAANVNCAGADRVCLNGACVEDPCQPNSCTPGTPVCTDGTHLATPAARCVATSATTHVCDAQVVDCAANGSGKVCFEDACESPFAPAAGDLLITEVMQRPTSGGQWFEVLNLTDIPLDLSGLKITATSTNATATVGAAVAVGAHDYFVFANGSGFGYDYSSSGLILGAADQLQIVMGTTEIAMLDYDFTDGTAGKAKQLASFIHDDIAAQSMWYWCETAGTPGAENTDCGKALTPPVDACIVSTATLDAEVGVARVVISKFREANVTDLYTAGNDYYPNVVAQVGYGAEADAVNFAWTNAGFDVAYNTATSPEDQMKGEIVFPAAGTFKYGFRYCMEDPDTGICGEWVYCDTVGKLSGTTVSSSWGTAAVQTPVGAIQAVLSAADGTVALKVPSAYVTYVRPASSNDVEGFFVQADQGGPALFVQKIMSSLSPAPAVGDKVSFTVTAKGTTNGVKMATAIADWTRVSSGNDISSLVEDVSNVNLLADTATMDAYTSKLIKVTGTISGYPSSGGTRMSKYTFNTVGVPAGTNLQFRLPATMVTDLELTSGCELTLNNIPLWRYNAALQPTAWTRAEIVDIQSCPARAPRVIAAEAKYAAYALIFFDKNIEAATLRADGSQFSFSRDGYYEGPTAVSATLTSPTIVLVKVSGAFDGGSEYGVSVANTLQSKRQLGIDPSFSTMDFPAYGRCKPEVVISQVYGAGGWIGAVYKSDFVELHNRGNDHVYLDGWSIQYGPAGGLFTSVVPLANAFLEPGGFLLVKLGGESAANGADLPTPDLTAGINLGSSAGKIALVRSTTPLAGECPVSPFPNDFVADLVGYGNIVNCSETSPDANNAAPAVDKVTSVQRNDSGCADTNNNQSDFTAGTPAARNSSSPSIVCGCN